MDKQTLEIGHPLKVAVYWYDKVPEPPRGETYEGEVVAWKEAQLVVRVPGYAVLRFWKKTGLEVSNGDHERRGFRVDLEELRQSINPNVPQTAEPITDNIEVEMS
jgi:hypothetical protein